MNFRENIITEILAFGHRMWLYQKEALFSLLLSKHCTSQMNIFWDIQYHDTLVDQESARSDWLKSQFRSLMQAYNTWQLLGFPWEGNKWHWLFSFFSCVNLFPIFVPRIFQVCWSIHLEKTWHRVFINSICVNSCSVYTQRYVIDVCTDCHKCKFRSVWVCINTFHTHILPDL